MAVISGKSDNFDQIISQDKVTIVDFFAQWCGPCKMLTPVFHKVAEEYADKMSFVSIDIDEEQEIAMKYEVQSVPTLIAIKNGEILKKALGAKNENQLKEWLEEYL